MDLLWQSLRAVYGRGPDWTHPLTLALGHREYRNQLPRLLPLQLLLAVIAGATVFAALPSLLGDAQEQGVAALWQLWACQISPLASALLIAVRCAPQRALQLQGSAADGERRLLDTLGGPAARWLAWPWMLAHALLAWTLYYLATGASLAVGVLLGWLLGEASPARLLDIALTTVPPPDYLLAGLGAAVLGWAGSTAAIVSLWPPAAQAVQPRSPERRLQRAARFATLASLALAIAGAVLWFGLARPAG